MLTREQFELELVRRQTPEVRNRLREGCVAVAGLGGLGSNIALMLARTGIKKLFLADFDTVDPSNLNRQAYTVSQMGMKKTDALQELIRQVNPWIELETFDGRVTEENVGTLFKPYMIICEAFDTPESKAVLVSGVLSKLPEAFVISGNGMAGSYSSNLIRTDKKMERLYVCGDGIHGISETESLTAARVSICAGHEANMAIRLILGEKEV
ncbi:thiamine biosynthesis protein ThiF [Anaerostipes sp.]|uniref:thiamine biosynthesis protein ThiF n=1 Tax=Anaerostipes sp. TaxID=1872530 RepID=UPI0025C74083|nr:thiamine biosynthesis protein ThiF [Anaerostipes sp.]MBS7008533.1 thiamine biosynthesis protein ThiF [Anaerostipes sp.]